MYGHVLFRRAFGTVSHKRNTALAFPFSLALPLARPAPCFFPYRRPFEDVACFCYSRPCKRVEDFRRTLLAHLRIATQPVYRGRTECRHFHRPDRILGMIRFLFATVVGPPALSLSPFSRLFLSRLRCSPTVRLVSSVSATWRHFRFASRFGNNDAVAATAA